MERLTHLQLSGGPLGDEGVMALAASKTLPRLSSLDLSSSGITDKGAKALVESESLRLEHLDLKENPAIGREHVRRLRSHFGVGVCTFSRERRARAIQR